MVVEGRKDQLFPKGDEHSQRLCSLKKISVFGGSGQQRDKDSGHNKKDPSKQNQI
jgi:hypothetical protein